MKKKKAIIVALLIIALIVWMASFVLADGNPAVVQAVTLNDLGVSNTGLLPSNPFYFSEEWMRNVQKVFTTNPVDKSKLELQILNDKAAELLEASTLNSVDADALNDAVNNYGNELQIMSTDLQALNSKSPEIDSLLSDLTAKLYIHYQILEGIKVQNGDTDGTISSIQKNIDTIISEIPAEMTNNSQFGNVLEEAVASQTDLGTEMRFLPFIDGLEISSGDTLIRSQLDQVRQDQVLSFEGRYDADGLSPNVIPGILGQLPVSDINKIKLTNDLRDFVVDGTLASQFTTFRNNLLTQASSSGEISSADVSGVVNYAGVLVSEIGNGQQADSKILLQANALLSQASNDSASSSYGNALGEASDAVSMLDGALLSSEEASANSKDNISNLSGQLSILERRATEQGLLSTDDPKLFALFGQIDSTLSNKPSVSDIYKVKEMLDEIGFAINDAQVGSPSALIPLPGEDSLQGSNSSQSVASQPALPGYCSEIYKPVCGSDGITYTNKCFQTLIDATSTYKGECKSLSTSTSTLLKATSTTQIQD